MTRVYSALLGWGDGITDGPIGIVPAGELWVVRHITALCFAVSSEPLEGFDITWGDGYPIWSTPDLGLCSKVTYDWAGRHAFPAGTTITLMSRDGNGWNVTMSGYSLTTP